jgi:transposase
LKIELLQPLAPELRAPIEEEWKRLAQEQQRLAGENKLLQDLIRLMRIEKYGAKSEQLSDGQLALLELEPGVAAEEVATEAQRSEEEKQKLEAEAAPAPPKRSHPGRRELPAHLPRVEEMLACTAQQCRCGTCGAETKIIGYDTSEELDMKPAEYFVRVIKREKRACTQCEQSTVHAAPLPPKIVERGKASNAVVVDVIIKKYAEHQPLYRQQVNLQRDAGVDLSRMTLCGWALTGGSWLQAIREAMRVDLLAGSYIQADETPVGVQTEGQTGSNHTAYLWQYSRPGGPVVFDFQMGRGREGLRQFLGSYAGRLQSDGYGAYDQIGGKGIVHCGCMAHLRRGFIKALKVAPGQPAAEEIVRLIAQLYAVEKQARENGLNHAQRRSLRQTASVPSLTELKAKIIATRQSVLPKSALGEACDYALRQWDRVSAYAEYGEVEIDNNWCENAMRPTVLGRKNWLHIGSEDAGPKIAAITSVIETCRRLTVNPREYLLEVLPQIPDWPAKRIAELTPMAWRARRAAG